MASITYISFGEEVVTTVSQYMKQGRFVKRLEDPKIARMLFGEVKWAWIWIPLRLYAGWQWLIAGWSKIGNPAWTGDSAGAAVTGFVTGALEKTGGAHPDVQGWYAWFLRNLVLPNSGIWSQMVAYGELIVGIALILGVFTGIAAFFGGFMNMNYLLAGTVSSNPLLLAIAIFLILAWKTAGWWGIDRWLLTVLGTPWRPGFIFKGNERDLSLEMEEIPA
ncbi:MAG: DoxX family membrane protein [Anaerolineales bacterium]|nr:DoxX family membrane protein [Anaerolineales bacterium]